MIKDARKKFKYNKIDKNLEIKRSDHKSTRKISIHAPARGATAEECMKASAILRFNPRPRTGGDKSNSN